jgi:D-tyrosyl-tRNA(Tyr) deacylase
VAGAEVRVVGLVVGAIERGLLVLLGVSHGDSTETARRLAGKVAALRVFEDPEGKMNEDIAAAGGAVLCVSQFTLYGDVRRGNRPSFTEAAPGPLAETLYNEFCEAIERAGLRCERGRFGAEMHVSLVNDGPVTLILDTENLERPRNA